MVQFSFRLYVDYVVINIQQIIYFLVCCLFHRLRLYTLYKIIKGSQSERIFFTFYEYYLCNFRAITLCWNAPWLHFYLNVSHNRSDLSHCRWSASANGNGCDWSKNRNDITAENEGKIFHLRSTPRSLTLRMFWLTGSKDVDPHVLSLVISWLWEISTLQCYVLLRINGNFIIILHIPLGRGVQ